MNTLRIAITLAALLACGGCGMLGRDYSGGPEPAPPAMASSAPTAAPPAPAPAGGLLQKPSSPEAAEQARESAIEAALGWARKYAQATEALQQSQKDKALALQQKQDLEKQVARLQTDLARSEKELQACNEMLLEMQQDLRKWKSDVLGFREEMRQAQAAQMNALVKVLTLMGGEIPGAPGSQTRPARLE